MNKEEGPKGLGSPEAIAALIGRLDRLHDLTHYAVLPDATALLELVAKQRDEARAEIDRLRDYEEAAHDVADLAMAEKDRADTAERRARANGDAWDKTNTMLMAEQHHSGKVGQSADEWRECAESASRQLAEARAALEDAADHFERIGKRALHWMAVFANSELGEARWSEIKNHALSRAAKARALLSGETTT